MLAGMRGQQWNSGVMQVGVGTGDPQTELLGRSF